MALKTVDQLAGRYEVQPDPGLEKSLLEGAADRLTMSEEGFALFVYRKDKLDSKLVKCHLARRTEPGHHGHGLLATSKSGTLLLRRDQGDVAALLDSRRCRL